MDPAFSLPDEGALAEGLGAVFGAVVTVLAREGNAYSTSPSEVVLCRPAGGPERRVFCKYAPPPKGAYEAEVYRRLSGACAPALLGLHRDHGAEWLVLEFLDAAARLDQVDDPESALESAALWLGTFHAIQERRLGAPELRFLHVLDSAAPPNAPAAALNHFGQPGTLGAAPLTVVHGDCTIHNILLHRGEIRVVDWEYAAVAAGEIDLAALTDGWAGQSVRHCMAAYSRARWAGAAPIAFEETFRAARIWWNLNRLDAELWRLDALRSLISETR